MGETNAAFVTGGTGALGRAVVRRFLDDGVAVAVTYRTTKEWDEVRVASAREADDGRLLGISADVTDPDATGAAVTQAATAFGGLRILAHVAGGYAGGTPVESIEPKTVRHMLDLNLASAFWAAKHVIPHAKTSGRGRLLFISSRGAVEASAGAAAYAASKAGLHALVATLAKEVGAFGVTANAVLPSVIDTPQNRAAMPNAKFETWVAPAQVAALLAFLASDAAGTTSGALIPIYGRA
jgi:NAD(P)-dependent dehydrogenase (short-subunit alcohol dehydrogenase family)